MNAMRNLSKILILGSLSVAAASCGDVARSGRAPVYLMIDSISGTRGSAKPGAPASVLTSDVLTLVTSPEPCKPENPCPTVFSDSGTVTFHLSAKDITSVGPTSNNQVTINRYHVSYKRADGRNTPGVDVPYAFDGAITITVPPLGTASSGFDLVRIVAKKESPLVQLVTNPTFITAIADVTFYGQDTVGNDIQASGSIQVNFGDFGDF
jgi:hypothetical protein